MAASRNFPAAFAAATALARPLPAPASRIVASDTVAEFIDACDSAVVRGLPDAGELLPGVDVAEPVEMLKAYLLFLAGEGVTCNSDAIDSARVKDWHARVTPRVWSLLGFRREPSLLTVQLAFSLLGQHAHVAAEMRALVWAVGDFAAIGLMPGLRT
jgi:hypothetical protein